MMYVTLVRHEKLRTACQNAAHHCRLSGVGWRLANCDCLTSDFRPNRMTYPVKIVRNMLSPAIWMLITVSACGNNRSANECGAMAAIMGNVVLQESAHRIVARSRVLTDEQRWLLLSDAVMPRDEPNRVCISAEITPASSPANGGVVVSPIIELLSAAKQMGRSDEVRHRLRSRLNAQLHLSVPQSSSLKVDRLAASILLDIGAQPPNVEGQDFRKLYELVDAQTKIPEAWHPALIVTLTAAIASPPFREAARDLAIRMQATYSSTVSAKRWTSHHRHTMAIAESASMEHNNAERNEWLQWHVSSLLNSKALGNGHPHFKWRRNAASVTKSAGHFIDHLHFRSPLSGNFEIEYDATGNTNGMTPLSVGGYWATTSSSLDTCFTGGRDRLTFDRFELQRPLTKSRRLVHYRTVVKDGHVTFNANGRPLLTKAIGEHSPPWISFIRFAGQHATLQNVRITGAPKIPSQISLTAASDFPGWFRFDNRISAGKLLHKITEDGPELTSTRISELAGTNCEQLLSYYRPMLEDGTIDFQFFYINGQSTAHPALGDLALLLTPDGVVEHRVTNGAYDRLSRNPDARSVKTENRHGPDRLPLLSNAWNAVRLQIVGDTLDLFLNDAHVYNRKIAPDAARHFGLFHFADQTSLQARNVIWSGDWPKTLPNVDAQELATDETAFLRAATEKLKHRLQHQFGAAVPNSVFDCDSAASDCFLPSDDGLVGKHTGRDRYAFTTLKLNQRIVGDFDIRLHFDQMHTQPVSDGSCGITLQAIADDPLSTEVNLRRRHNRKSPRHGEQQLVFSDKVQRTPEGEQRLTIGLIPEESSAGSLRLVRVGSRLYSLYAEGDSEHFRLTAETDFSDADLRDLNIRLWTFRPGKISVRLKAISIRAAEMVPRTGIAVVPQQTVAEIDQSSAALKSVADFSFMDAAPDRNDFFPWGVDDPWSASLGGYRIVHRGTTDWSSSGIATLKHIEGDFDVAVNFVLEDIVNPEQGRESAIFLKIDFDEQTHVAMILEQLQPGVRRVNARLGTPRQNGKSHVRTIARVPVSNLTSVRIVRLGAKAYFMAKIADDQPEFLLGAATVTTAPIPRAGLDFMVHTGGEGRETRVLLKKLTVRTDTPLAKTSPQFMPRSTPPERRRSSPPQKGFWESLFDGF